MKFRIQSRAKSIREDKKSERVNAKLIFVNEVLEFDHYPTGDEIQVSIASLPKYRSCKVCFLETLAIQKLAD